MDAASQTEERCMVIKCRHGTRELQRPCQWWQIATSGACQVAPMFVVAEHRGPLLLGSSYHVHICAFPFIHRLDKIVITSRMIWDLPPFPLTAAFQYMS